jgi:hypothetical protein
MAAGHMIPHPPFPSHCFTVKQNLEIESILALGDKSHPVEAT